MPVLPLGQGHGVPLLQEAVGIAWVGAGGFFEGLQWWEGGEWGSPTAEGWLKAP